MAINSCIVSINFKCLKNNLPEGSRLNDEIIDNYANLLQKKNNNQWLDNATSCEKCFFLSSYFYQHLVQFELNKYDYLSVKKYCHNLNDNTVKNDIFSIDKLFVPICRDNHWILVMILMKDKIIRYYDSMGKSQIVLKCELYSKHILRWIQDEYNTLNSGNCMCLDEWKIEFEVCCPQQNNGIDCGVFVVEFMDLLSDNLQVNTVTQENMAYYRAQIGCDLLRRKLHYYDNTVLDLTDE